MDSLIIYDSFNFLNELNSGIGFVIIRGLPVGDSVSDNNDITRGNV